MKRKILWIAVLCMTLCGCSSWMDGSYVSVTPHQQQLSGTQSGSVSASNYMQLREVLEEMVDSGVESAVINVSEYNQEQVEAGVEMAVRYLQQTYPLGAYAIEKIDYEIGIGGGKPAVSVNISYLHGRSEIRKIQTVSTMEEAQERIAEALRECDAGVVLLVKQYQQTDIAQLVEDFALENPDVVMETPQAAVGIYPEIGAPRVVELKFTYQTSRDSLRQMQSQVQQIFSSASLYVSGDAPDSQKYAQLYAFLMERYDYKIETSITPSYSLLRHGVGDSQAFACVYAAMCRQAGMECQIVSGTKNGESWYWNMIHYDDVYYHVDLLSSSAEGGFRVLTDVDMDGYVWDYSAYEASVVPETEPENISE